MSAEQVSKSVNIALADAGLVLLVTGAGGSFGQVLGATNIGKVLAQSMISYNVPAILLAWIIAAAIKFAQGSGTVAIITTANLIAPVAAQLGLPGLWLALAIGSGALLGCHVNDSGFWVVAKIAGLNTRGAFKVYTLPTAINAISTLVVILILSPFLFR
jgi:GntP family gluconate:H+ symporter